MAQKLPDSQKEKARKEKKMIVNFSPSKEELAVMIDGKNVIYYNSEKVLELIDRAKKYKNSDSEFEIVETCNACGVDNGHADNCELSRKEKGN